MAENAFFIEAFGAALVYSFNYERILFDRLAVRVGIGFLPNFGGSDSSGLTPGTTTSALLIPVTVSYVGIRSGPNGLELGGGVTVLDGITEPDQEAGSSQAIRFLGVAMAGYRYQPPRRAGITTNFMFRVGVEAVAFRTESSGDLAIVPWPYLSVGASFWNAPSAASERVPEPGEAKRGPLAR